VSEPGTLFWFGRHECRLAWRDWLAMVTANRRRRASTVAIGLAAFAAFMHLLAYGVVGRFAGIARDGDQITLVVITGSLLLSWSLMVSQAMESATRAFYARSDLDLILSSPASAEQVHCVRLAAMAVSISLMGLFLAAPFINVLALLGGATWIAAYGVVLAMGIAATAVGVALTITLFRVIGPRRTRLVAQILAAVIGAAVVIGLQVSAIASGGTLSRIDFLTSRALLVHAPDAGSILYMPACAVLGNATALAGVLAASLVSLGITILLFAPRFGNYAMATAGVSRARAQLRCRPSRFGRRTPRCTLRQKEWKLLLRDPWLISQSLMQILYLLPPALLLWRGFGEDSNALAVLVSVLVMAAGQLAGGLAWIAVSGEDAPELVGSAPVPPSHIMRAKFEAVLGAIAVVFMPFVAALALASPRHAIAAALGIIVASASAIAIQLWFRSQARRGDFRRRHVSSRTATFAEAFSSISLAATAAFAAVGSLLGFPIAAVALAVLAAARWLSPAHLRDRGAAVPVLQYGSIER
jgi:ABC-2 type transport system permease protein